MSSFSERTISHQLSLAKETFKEQMYVTDQSRHFYMDDLGYPIGWTITREKGGLLSFDPTVPPFGAYSDEEGFEGLNLQWEDVIHDRVPYVYEGKTIVGNPQFDKFVDAKKELRNSRSKNQYSQLKELSEHNREISPLKVSRHYPHLTVNDQEYELLCEFTTRNPNGECISIYNEVDGQDVFVQLPQDRAIAGLFSTAPDKVSMLFDYMEGSLTSTGSITCFESEGFPKLLDLAKEQGREYLKIPLLMNNQKLSPFDEFKSRMFPSQFLSNALMKEIKAHSVPAVYDDGSLSEKTANEDYEAPYEDPGTSCEQAASLPSGWTWVCYNDFSGSLRSPEDQKFFSYDGTTHAGIAGIEYQETEKAPWSFFEGSFPEFQKMAESYVAKKVLSHKTKPLSEQIKQANEQAAGSVSSNNRIPSSDLSK